MRPVLTLGSFGISCWHQFVRQPQRVEELWEGGAHNAPSSILESDLVISELDRRHLRIPTGLGVLLTLHDH
jgi:hypothetical protein